VYRLTTGELYYEPKFMDGKLKVTLDQFKEGWPTYTLEEKRDFLQSYAVKPALSEDDYGILRYLIECGSDEECGLVAHRMTELPERERVLEFLLTKVGAETSYFPNYVQALEILGGGRACALLEDKFRHYKAKLSGVSGPLSLESFLDFHNYLTCCEALITLTASKEARAAVDAMTSFDDERVRSIAQRIRQG